MVFDRVCITSATKMENRNHCQICRRGTSYRSGHQLWEPIIKQCSLARKHSSACTHSSARTSETNRCRRFPLDLRALSCQSKANLASPQEIWGSVVGGPRCQSGGCRGGGQPRIIWEPHILIFTRTQPRAKAQASLGPCATQ